MQLLSSLLCQKKNSYSSAIMFPLQVLKQSVCPPPVITLCKNLKVQLIYHNTSVWISSAVLHHLAAFRLHILTPPALSPSPYSLPSGSLCGCSAGVPGLLDSHLPSRCPQQAPSTWMSPETLQSTGYIDFVCLSIWAISDFNYQSDLLVSPNLTNL